MKNQTPKIDVEKLLSKGNQPTNSAIKKALETVKAEEEAKLQHDLINRIADVQSRTKQAVEDLRKCRAKEKQSKNILVGIAAAEEQFYIDADWNKYQDAVREAYFKA